MRPPQLAASGFSSRANSGSVGVDDFATVTPLVRGTLGECAAMSMKEPEFTTAYISADQVQMRRHGDAGEDRAPADANRHRGIAHVPMLRLPRHHGNYCRKLSPPQRAGFVVRTPQAQFSPWE